MSSGQAIKPIKTVAVIGAGVMGAGIAAQAANGGARVILLDIPAPDTAPGDTAEARNAIAAGARERMLKAGSRGALMDVSVAERIQIGNIDDDLEMLAEADWIIEVVVERLDIKQDLYRRIEQVRATDAVVSSNTSTIPLETLMEGMLGTLREHFVVTHFFNPPRHMRLLELVSSDETRPEVAERVDAFIDHCMGKTVIRCNDRPGFIANRLGVYWMQVALQEAVALGLSVEDADAVMQVCGFPKTGIFGLWDLVGIDLMPEVTASLSRLLPETDPFQAYSAPVPVINGMVKNGWFGRKGRVLQGFYRQRLDDNGNKVREVLDLASLSYREPQASELNSAQLKAGQLQALIQADDKGGRYARQVLTKVLDYASRLVPDVAAEISSVDAAMRLGYNWRYGPFELMDRIGMPALREQMYASGTGLSLFMQQAAGRNCYQEGQQLDEQGVYQPHQPAAGIIEWHKVCQQAPVRTFAQSVLHELDEDTWCLAFTSRVNALSNQLLDEIETALAAAISRNKALIFYSDSGIFAAGADLKEFLQLSEQEAGLDTYMRRGQQLFAAIRNADIPVVAAVAGKALGGGVELMFHCHGVQVHAESSLGLVESSVGIVPGWCGCKELLARTQERFGSEAAVEKAFELIAHAKVTGSAIEAREQGFLREADGVSMNRDRLLSDATALAKRLRNPDNRTRFNELPALKACTPQQTAEENSYQYELEEQLLQLLNAASRPGWYDGFGDLERECNLILLQNPASGQRMEHLLTTGKVLQN